MRRKTTRNIVHSGISFIRKKSWQIRSDRLQRREMNQNADLFMPFIRSRRAIIFVLMIIMKLIWRNFRQNSNR